MPCINALPIGLALFVEFAPELSGQGPKILHRARAERDSDRIRL